MAFCLEANEPVEIGFKRIVREQVNKAVAEIDDTKLPRHEAVHQVRKRCKKIRAALKLFRPAFDGQYREENDFFRQIARELSDLRDARVMVATYAALLKKFGQQIDLRLFVSLRRKLIRHCEDLASQNAGEKKKLETARSQLCEAYKRISHWQLSAQGFDSVKGGLQKTYARGRKAMKLVHVKSDAKNFHNWRKRAKYHRYHLRLLQHIWSPMMKAYRNEAAILASLLGAEHDLTVLHDTIFQNAHVFGDENVLKRLAELMDQQSRHFRSKAQPLGRRLFAEKPKHLVKRLHQYWKAASLGD